MFSCSSPTRHWAGEPPEAGGRGSPTSGRPHLRGGRGQVICRPQHALGPISAAADTSEFDAHVTGCIAGRRGVGPFALVPMSGRVLSAPDGREHCRPSRRPDLAEIRAVGPLMTARAGVNQPQRPRLAARPAGRPAGRPSVPSRTELQHASAASGWLARPLSAHSIATAGHPPGARQARRRRGRGPVRRQASRHAGERGDDRNADRQDRQGPGAGSIASKRLPSGVCWNP